MNKRFLIRFEVIDLESEDEELNRPYGFVGKIYFKKTGRILGCQSKNHTLCRGELWTCERCGKRVCWEEGSADLPEICDDCWVDVRELGQPWENPSRWNDETIWSSNRSHETAWRICNAWTVVSNCTKYSRFRVENKNAIREHSQNCSSARWVFQNSPRSLGIGIWERKSNAPFFQKNRHQKKKRNILIHSFKGC